MFFSKDNETPRAELSIDNIQIEQVESFKYLGTIKTEDGRTETEIKKRAGIAKEKFSELNKLLKSK